MGVSGIFMGLNGSMHENYGKFQLSFTDFQSDSVDDFRGFKRRSRELHRAKRGLKVYQGDSRSFHLETF